MEEENLLELLHRYLTAREEGKDPYFDTEEICDLLNGFEDTDDFTYYEEVLDLAFRLHPVDINEWKIRKCKLYMYGEAYDEALNTAESIDEYRNYELDMIRIECYCMLELYDKVMEYVENLRIKNCEYLEDIYEFAIPLLADFEKLAEAHKLLSKAISIFPESFILKEELAYVLELEGRYEQAIRICRELIDRDPYSYDIWFSLGRLYSLTAKFDKALEAFDFALACDDTDVELKILKAYCLFMNESYSKAIDLYMEIATDEDTLDHIKPLVAECYIRLDEFEEAYQLYKEIIHEKKESLEPITYLNHIRCCLETDRGREAFRMLRNAASIFPGNIRILSLLALSYLEKGNEEQALAITNKIFKQLEQFQEKDEFIYANFLFNQKPERYIPIKELAKEYLNNKDNRN